MALTPSTMLPLGTTAPHFALPDANSDTVVSLDDVKSARATVILFISNHCPYVKHIIDGIVDLSNAYIPKEISFVAISANDVENYPEDSPEKMQQLARSKGFKFPYLFDESQEVARAYQAACTPDIFIFDKNLKCVYRGQFDSSRPGNNIPCDGKDVKMALDNILANKPVSQDQTPSMGCNIKWKE